MLAQWVEFINVHILHPLNFSVFLSLLQNLVKDIQNNSVTQEEVNGYLQCIVSQIVVRMLTFVSQLKSDISLT